jgi:nucleoid DNA-binding protein
MPRLLKSKLKKSNKIERLSRVDFLTAVSNDSNVNRKDVENVLSTVAKVTKNALKQGKKLDIPGVCSLHVIKKPATKAGKRMAFGKMVSVKARKASNVTKARPAADLRKL